jgi:hypothetical protein
MLHVLEVGQAGPLASGDREPSLPGRGLNVRWRPIRMNQDMLSKIGDDPIPRPRSTGPTR